MTLVPVPSLILQDTHEVLTSLIGSHALLTWDALPVLCLNVIHSQCDHLTVLLNSENKDRVDILKVLYTQTMVHKEMKKMLSF